MSSFVVFWVLELVGAVGVGGPESASESASSSHESATSSALFFVVFTSGSFGFGVGRETSLIEPSSLRESWRREEWSSESVSVCQIQAKVGEGNPLTYP